MKHKPIKPIPKGCHDIPRRHLWRTGEEPLGTRILRQKMFALVIASFSLLLTAGIFGNEFADGNLKVDGFQIAEHETLIKRGAMHEQIGNRARGTLDAQSPVVGIDNLPMGNHLSPTLEEARAALVELVQTGVAEVFTKNREKLVKELQVAPFVPRDKSKGLFILDGVPCNFNDGTFTFVNFRGRFVRDEQGQWHAEILGRMPIGEPSRKGSSGGKGG